MDLTAFIALIKELIPVLSVIAFFITYVKFKNENEKVRETKIVDETNQKNKIANLEDRIKNLESTNEQVTRIQSTIMKLEIHFENLSKRLEENLSEIKQQLCKE